MPEASISVNYGGMESAVQEVNRVANQLEQDLRTLNGQVKRARQYWEGDAEVSFAATEAQWEKQAESIRATLKVVAAKVAQAGESYKTADRSAARNFG